MPQTFCQISFPSYLLEYPQIVICLAYTSKKCEIWRPHLRETPIMALPNLTPKSQIFERDPHYGTQISSSYLPILKISSVQGEWFSFKFWRASLRGIPLFWYPQILSKSIISSFLPILKISSVQRKWLNFEIWGSCLKRILSFWYPKFLQIWSFLHLCKF